MRALVLAAALVLALALAALWRRRPEHFSYSPSCGSARTGRQRAECRGITTGVMPSIETTDRLGNGRCCGRIGVPP